MSLAGTGGSPRQILKLGMLRAFETPPRLAKFLITVGQALPGKSSGEDEEFSL